MSRISRLPALCGLLFFTISHLLSAAAPDKFLSTAAAATHIHHSSPSIYSDTLPPVLICPATLTVTLGAGRCDTFFQYTVTLTDNEPGATMTQLSGTPPTGATLAVGKTVNLFHAADAAGNTSTCVFSVRVKHPAVPLACRDTLQVPLDASCSFSVQYLDLLSSSGYGCPQNFTLEMDTLLPLGDGPWLPPLSTLGGRRSLLGYRVSDVVTASKCSGVLHLRDTTLPSLTCEDVLTSSLIYNPTPGTLAGFKLSGAYPTATDNCVDILYYELTSSDSNLLDGGCAQVYQKIRRIWTARDKQGNTASCSQVITLLNPDLDEVQFPTDYAIGCPSTIYNFISYPFVVLNGQNYPLHEYNSKFIVGHIDALLGKPCEGAALWQRIWVVVDKCTGKIMRDTHLVEAKDKERVAVHCKILTLLPAKSVDGCTAAIDLPDLYLDDLCSRVASITAFWTDAQGMKDSLAGSLMTFPEYSTTRRDTLGHFNTIPDFPLGQTAVTFLATDPCGNTGTCMTRVSVLDKKPPTAVCDTLITVFLGKNGKAQLYADKFNTASFDNCTAPQSLEFRVRRADGLNGCLPVSPLYDAWARFCCADLGDTVPVSLRVYDIDFGTDTISANRFAGQHNDCTARVLVRDSLPPICSLPPIISLGCTTWRDELAKFDPYQFTSCSTDSVLVKIDSSQLSLCGEGKITRNISVFDAQGQHTGTCKQTVSVYPNSLFYVKFPNDTDSYGKCPKALGDTGEPIFYTPNCNQYEMWHTDSLIIHPTNPCFIYIRRRWHIKNTCIAPLYGNGLRVVPNPEGDLGPTVSSAHLTGGWASTKAPAAPNGQINNYWWYQNAYGYEYDQHIRLRTLLVSSDAEASGTTSLGGVPYIADSTLNDGLLWNSPFFGNPFIQGNDLNEAPTDLTFSVRDTCGMGRLHISYQLNLDLDNDDTRETKVNSLSCGSGNRGMVQFNNNKPGSTSSWTQFDSRPLPDHQKYCFAVRIDTSGGLFTAHTAWWDGLTSSIVPLHLPHGQHEIVWSVESGCNNWERNKSILFTVGPANPSQYKVAGQVRTELSVGIEDVKTSLQSPTLTAPEVRLTDDAGAYQFASPLFESLHYAIVPEKDQNPLNGVSTYDLTLISKHILGIEAITSPYRLIAADANRSGSVTTFDIVELRKLILGIYPKLPNAPSWRFVPKSFVFPQPDNPFVKGFPEKIERHSLPADRPDEDFVGIKVGDLNGSVVSNAQNQTEDRSGHDPIALETDDRPVQSGELFTVEFSIKKPVVGYQFTLETPGLSIVGVESGPAMSPEHFSVLSDALAVSFEATRGRETRFQVTFKAEKSGTLSQMLHLSDRLARSEAYPLHQPLPPAEMSLRFQSAPGAAAASREFELFPNQPNPFADETLLPFYLPADGRATLTVYDPAGRTVLVRSAAFPQGFRSFLLKKRDLGAALGVLYYQIETPDGAGTGKMVVVE